MEEEEEEEAEEDEEEEKKQEKRRKRKRKKRQRRRRRRRWRRRRRRRKKNGKKAFQTARWKRSHPSSLSKQNIEASQRTGMDPGSSVVDQNSWDLTHKPNHEPHDSLPPSFIPGPHFSLSASSSVWTSRGSNTPSVSPSDQVITKSRSGDTESGGGHRLHPKRNRHKQMVKRSHHHISRRSFDSIDMDSGLHGLSQNFFGSRVAMKNDPYTYGVFTDLKREGNNPEEPSLNEKTTRQEDSEDLENLRKLTLEDDDEDKGNEELDIVLSLLPLWDRWVVDSPKAADDLSEVSLNNNFGYQDHDTINDFENNIRKRGFDSISRWRGGLSGISQNFIGPKRDDFDSIRKNLNYRNPVYSFGWKKRESQERSQTDKRSFDSISNRFTSGLSQNHWSKKASSPREDRWWGHGLRQNYWAKRDFEKLGMGNNNLAEKFIKKKRFPSRGTNLPSLAKGYIDNARDYEEERNKMDVRSVNRPRDISMVGDNDELPHKRSFDSINRGQLSGLGQNHMKKRAPELTANSHIQAIRGVGSVSRRSFDSINDRSELSGAFQNYVNTRNLETDPGNERDFALKQWKRFDSISVSPLGGMGQNFISKKTSDSLNLSPNHYGIYKTTFDPFSMGLLGGVNQHFIIKRSISSQAGKKNGQHNARTRNKRQFDSSLGGLRQNFVSSKRPPEAGPPQSPRSGVTSFTNKFPRKRSLDSIERNSLRGLAQNFFSKRSFDSIERGRVSGLRQNFISKRNLDSVGDSRMGGLRQNFLSKRNLDFIDNSGVGGLRQNYLEKKNFDSINDGRVGGFSQNFVNKRGFDSIGLRHLSGLRQNFIDKRNFITANHRDPFSSKRSFDSIDNTGLGGLGQNFISKRSFSSLDNSQMGGFRQNFVSKRYFDSISNGGLDGMRQNFISKRLRYLAAKSPSRKDFGLRKILKQLQDASTQATRSRIASPNVQFPPLESGILLDSPSSSTDALFHSEGTSAGGDTLRSGSKMSENNEGQVPVARDAAAPRFSSSNHIKEAEKTLTKLVSNSADDETKVLSEQRDAMAKIENDSAKISTEEETR
ncbi:pedal peptide 4 [Plakobranchus ocellatus]|uniref:Pedal peptide 4 n=1 Tax=Plakobranchus ocellatus TaxID=259542 RepID=A0AAV3Y1F8_9GAST|nr:pedal peptide 4 [Plakobranchus ocellatus]